MKKALFGIAFVLGCEAGVQVRPPVPVFAVGATVATPPPGAEGATVATPPEGQQAAAAGPSCQGDAQCLTEQDVIVCEQKWLCWVSHTMTQPTEQSKWQGQFLEVPNEKQIWTDKWYVSRPLQQNEQLRLGQPVLFSLTRLDNGVWMPPTDHNGALKVRWQYGAVTDLSDLFKGVVHVGDQQAHVTNVRVITSGGSQTPPP